MSPNDWILVVQLDTVTAHCSLWYLFISHYPDTYSDIHLYMSDPIQYTSNETQGPYASQVNKFNIAIIIPTQASL